MTMENPITLTEYENEGEYIQSLINSLKEIAVDKNQVTTDEGLLISAVKSLTKGKKGTSRLQGTQEVLKISQRENVSYSKPKGTPHPLELLTKRFFGLADMVRMEYKEKGGAIGKLLKAYKAGEELTKDEKELAEDLNRVRSVSLGKPTLTIEDKEEDDA